MYQSTEIIGNLGRDPEMRYLPQGDAVTNLNVAVNKVVGSGDDRVKQTVWFRVSVFGPSAEACNEYLHSGSQVFVRGELQFDFSSGGPKLWTDRDGAVRASFELRAFTVKFLGGRADASESAQQASGQGGHQDASGTVGVEEEDEIPF